LQPKPKMIETQSRRMPATRLRLEYFVRFMSVSGARARRMAGLPYKYHGAPPDCRRRAVPLPDRFPKLALQMPMECDFRHAIPGLLKMPTQGA